MLRTPSCMSFIHNGQVFGRRKIKMVFLHMFAKPLQKETVALIMSVCGLRGTALLPPSGFP